MNGKAFLMRSLVGVLVLVLALPPPGTFAQSSGTRAAAFTQEELDQMLAPIALYPDSLLAQVLVAATYPEQVMEADRWVKENSGMEGDRLNDALDKMDWDLSVKALVPFPKVLDMMSAKREWSERLGEAFLAQESDVMDSVQKLRSRAHAQGNLKTTREQKVVVRGESVEILPVDPQVVYVPAYNPTVVYGPWWYPAYPPFAYSPWYPSYVYDPYYVVPGFIFAGAFGFGVGIGVSTFWHHGWGRWDWGRRNVVVNVNRTVNINRVNVRNTRIRTTTINRAAREGRIGSPAVRNAARQRTGGRPTATSVQRDLRQRQSETRSGARQGRGSERELRGQRSTTTQRGERNVTRDSRGVSRGERGVSRGADRGQSRNERAISRGDRGQSRNERAVSRGDRGQARGSERALRGGGAGGAGVGAARGGGAPRGGNAPRGGGGRSGGGEKREHRQ